MKKESPEAMIRRLSNVGGIHFRLQHHMVLGRCSRCGIMLCDLARWPTLQCLPETRAFSVVRYLPGETVFEVHE